MSAAVCAVPAGYLDDARTVVVPDSSCTVVTHDGEIVRGAKLARHLDTSQDAALLLCLGTRRCVAVPSGVSVVSMLAAPYGVPDLARSAEVRLPGAQRLQLSGLSPAGMSYLRSWASKHACAPLQHLDALLAGRGMRSDVAASLIATVAPHRAPCGPVPSLSLPPRPAPVTWARVLAGLPVRHAAPAAASRQVSFDSDDGDRLHAEVGVAAALVSSSSPSPSPSPVLERRTKRRRGGVKSHNNNNRSGSSNNSNGISASISTTVTNSNTNNNSNRRSSTNCKSDSRGHAEQGAGGRNTKSSGSRARMIASDSGGYDNDDEDEKVVVDGDDDVGDDDDADFADDDGDGATKTRRRAGDLDVSSHRQQRSSQCSLCLSSIVCLSDETRIRDVSAPWQCNVCELYCRVERTTFMNLHDEASGAVVSRGIDLLDSSSPWAAQCQGRRRLSHVEFGQGQKAVRVRAAFVVVDAERSLLRIAFFLGKRQHSLDLTAMAVAEANTRSNGQELELQCNDLADVSIPTGRRTEIPLLPRGDQRYVTLVFAPEDWIEAAGAIEAALYQAKFQT